MTGLVAAKGHEAEMRRCLTDLDVTAFRRLWRHIASHLMQPADDKQALALMHRARTETIFMPVRMRAYSHRWLLDHGLPSGLPDTLKPSAERMYPRIATMVGTSVNFTAKSLRPVGDEIEATLSIEILDAFATDKPDAIDHLKLRGHLIETNKRAQRQLIGRVLPTA